MKILVTVILVLCAVAGLQFFLYQSHWSDKDVVEGWGRLLSSRSDKAFKPNLNIIIAGESFQTNKQGERDFDHVQQKSPADIRIGVFGGLNVLGFTLPQQKTLAHFMKINPPPTCELQGRSCQFFSYGRLSLNSTEAIKLIKEKFQDDELDIAVWVVDPVSDIRSLPKLPWTPLLAVNWLASKTSWSVLQKHLRTDLTVTPELSSSIDELRSFIFQIQKDLVPLIVPGMDMPMADQKAWEKESASSFFNQGFLPVRARTLIQENTRSSLALMGTGLMGDESLRALASLLNERLNQSPQMKKHAN